jgi:replication factor C subunit 1
MRSHARSSAAAGHREVALYAGLCPVGFGASDERPKRAIAVDIADAFANGGIEGRSCLVFDEVDGMGGGLTELVRLVDRARVPVICICNNRSRKMQTLGNRSVDMQFVAPLAGAVAQRLRTIADAEHIAIADAQLLDIAKASRGDVRSAIKTLQFWADGTRAADEDTSQMATVLIDALEASQKLLNPKSSFGEGYDAYFVDSGIVPLYLYENLPCLDKHQWADAMESFADGDVIDSVIRSDGAWELLPANAVFSAVFPATISPGAR